MHRDSQDFAAFSNSRNRASIYRTCQCGAAFVATRSFIRWCSVKCRKQFYSDRRALLSGDWRAKRKAKHETIGSHTRWEWSQVIRRHGNKCYWCGKLLKRAEATRDHLTPISRGGSDRIDNIVPSCMACNMEKRARTEAEYRKFIADKNQVSTD